MGPRAGLKVLRSAKDLPPPAFEPQIVQLLAQHYSDCTGLQSSINAVTLFCFPL